MNFIPFLILCLNSIVLAETTPQLQFLLHPNIKTRREYFDTNLNGMKVFKMQEANNNLAGPNPDFSPHTDYEPDKNLNNQESNSHRTRVIVGGVVGCVAIFGLGLFVLVLCKRQKKTKSMVTSSTVPTNNTTDNHASSLPSNHCRHFLFAEIEAATNKFDETRLLAEGEFGKVYRGEFEDGTKVAIKRAYPKCIQYVDQFQTEIEILSKLHHQHLVSLIGYCEENKEMIIVYDYMTHGALHEHLYKTSRPPLPWKKRLEICIGVARGLHYLHTGTKHTIIHRDVKISNILLDENWIAKLSNFRLSTTGPHECKKVIGTFGYMAPEYLLRGELTEKSDMYSFGMVMFQILCSRPTMISKENAILVDWVRNCQQKGVLNQIIDPHLKGKIAPRCLEKFMETAMRCVSNEEVDRPTSSDVLWNLDFVLELQEAAEESGGMMAEGVLDVDAKEDMDVEDPSLESTTNNTITSTSTMSMGGQHIVGKDPEDLMPSAVFSKGR